jgi:hypothetical protein
MKMIAEYLDNATKFERMAARERDPKLKAELESQAVAYRKLAEQRARKYGYAMPPQTGTQQSN